MPVDRADAPDRVGEVLGVALANAQPQRVGEVGTDRDDRKEDVREPQEHVYEYSGPDGTIATP